MANQTFSSPAFSANGQEMTATVGGGTWASVVIDATKITLTVTGRTFDNTGASGTTTVTLNVVSATFSGGTMTFKLDGKYGSVYTNDTAGSLTMSAGAVSDGTDQNAALGATSVTNNSTLAEPGYNFMHWLDAAHQRYTGTVTLRALAYMADGIACMKFRLIQTLTVTTDASGITGANFVYPGTITFSGGATGTIAPGSDLATGAGVRTVKCFIRTGTVGNGETATQTESAGSAFTVASSAGGEALTSTVTALSDRSCGSNGLATLQDMWSSGALVPTQLDAYQRSFQMFPIRGGTSFDTRDLTLNTAVNALDGYQCRGEDEVWCDPSNTESAKQKNYYVDQTSSATCTGGTGTFGAFELCKVMTGATLSAVVYAIGTSAGGTQVAPSSFRYNRITFAEGVYQAVITAPSGRDPAYGDIVVENATYDVGNAARAGFVLAYDSGTGTMTYVLRHGTNFASLDILKLVDQDFVAVGSTFATALPGTVIGTTVSSGDVVTGFQSGATCTLSGAPVINGSDSNTGASNSPFFTQQKALKQAATDRGDSLGDGVTIYCKQGLHYQQYSAGNDTETRHYWATITNAPGTSVSLVRMVRYNTASTNGNNTNFVRYYNVTLWSTTANSGTNVLTLPSTGGVAGSYDRPAHYFDNCAIMGFLRCGLGSIQAWVSSNGPFYSFSNNCTITRINHLCRTKVDCFTSVTANDTNTQCGWIANCRDYDINANGTGFHCDAFQLQFTEKGNRGIWGYKAHKLGFFQDAPFLNGASGAISNMGFVNMLQAADDSANISQMGNANGAGTPTISDCTWAYCTLQDSYSWRASASGRNLAVVNIRARACVWLTHAKTDTGTITGLNPACYDNNHFITSPGANASNDTTGSTFATLMTEATDNNSVAFLVPAVGSSLRSRVSSRPNGHPTRDVYGNPVTSNSAIGAAQDTNGANSGTPFTHAGSVIGITGNTDWTNKPGAIGDDASPAYCAVTAIAPTTYVLCVPISATTITGTVTGIMMRVKRKSNPGIEGVIDITIKLASGTSDVTLASIGSDNKAINNPIGNPYNVDTYGGSGQLWGVAAATLKTLLQAGTLCFCQQYQAQAGTDEIDVDDVSIVIYSNPSGTTTTAFAGWRGRNFRERAWIR